MSRFFGLTAGKLQEAIEGLTVHDHLSLIYETREEQLASILPFIRIGLNQGNKFLLLADEIEISSLISSLSSHDTEIDLELKKRRVEFVGVRNPFLNDGSFSAKNLSVLMEELVSKAKAQGFPSLRVAIEMASILENEKNLEKMTDFESRLNLLIPNNELLVVCMYDRKKFPAEVIRKVIYSHPWVIHEGMVVKNFYYIPPEQMRDETDAKKEVDRLIMALRTQGKGEEALRQSRKRYQGVLDSTGEGFWMLDEHGKIIEVNRAICSMLGKKAYEIIGRSPMEIMVGDNRSTLESELSQLDQRNQRKFELKLRKSSGESLDVLVNASSIMGALGRKRGSFALISDITELKATTDAVKRQKGLLDSITEAQQQYIAAADHKGVFLHLLDSALRLTDSEYGFIAELMYEENGKPFLRNICIGDAGWTCSTTEFLNNFATDPMDFPRLDNLFGNAVITGKPVISNHPQLDERSGRRIPEGHPPVNTFLGLPLFIGGVLVGAIGLSNRKEGYNEGVIVLLKPLLTTCANIIASVKNGRKLRSAEADRDRFFQLSFDILAIVGFDGFFKRINPSIEKILGYSATELLSKRFIEFVHPDDREITLAEAAKIQKGQTAYYFENRYLCKNGSYKWLAWSAVPFLPEGVMYSVAHDITDRKHYEEEILRSNKELEQMAYVASHDLQEPLRTVSSYVQLLKRRYGGTLGQEADAFMNFAIDGTIRLQHLIQDLLLYSQVTTKGKPLTPMASREALDRAVLNLNLMIEDNHGTITSDWLPQVLADESQLTQVFQNLLANSLKFKSQLAPTIRIGAKKIGSMCLFSVHDNGIGIESKNFEKIFVMFHRLHSRSEYEGTGIGLALCKKIIIRHGGTIWVESFPGQGSTFYFTIPLAPEE